MNADFQMAAYLICKRTCNGPIKNYYKNTLVKEFILNKIRHFHGATFEVKILNTNAEYFVSSERPFLTDLVKKFFCFRDCGTPINFIINEFKNKQYNFK